MTTRAMAALSRPALCDTPPDATSLRQPVVVLLIAASALGFRLKARG